ncbi:MULTISPECIES: helix-turn-helix domain-containing protein [Liquorilactobacillus]|uniref:Helix-turn-helix domain-containing protein n=1 Tax=Liquorilactobacillus aquaticus DSM 21051 TaxID=1423725 RepID=A0A0R2CVY2_9LACO|nr:MULTISPECIES: helix-turn-helix domain-containing protein [Liquorilactobacillus]KRM95982.1 hypothetical protein FC19_GL001464 [Liquorilactobacillus aquaticus DSM 21051]
MTEINLKLSDGFEKEITQIVVKAVKTAQSESQGVKTYPEYMSIIQTCEYANIGRSTLEQNWIKKRGLPTISVGGLTRIKKSDLDTFLSEFK